MNGLPTADFFAFESLLNPTEQAKLAALELSAPAQRGYSNLFAGIIIAEMTRVDTSLATFSHKGRRKEVHRATAAPCGSRRRGGWSRR